MPRRVEHGPIAVVPARGGSKRIPRKNIKEFAGRPLISWTIQKLLGIDLFDEIFVSTDDREIADLVRAAGATVLEMRPAHLSDDHTTTAAVLDHELHVIEEHLNASVRSLCTVYPAAVLVPDDAISGAHRMLHEHEFDAVISALPYPAPIERAWIVGADGTASMRSPEHSMTRSQDLPAKYYDAGQFYWSSRSYWPDQLRGEGLSARIGLYPLKPWEAVDIDTLEDWEFAERLFQISR